MTLRERADAFERAYPTCEAAWPRLVREQGRDVIYATWVCGNDYRNRSRYYGAYPPRFLDRVMAFFPDAAGRVLHAFSGSLPPGPYVRLDLNTALQPDVVGNVYDAQTLFGADRFWLTVADPPYTAADATRYGTPMIDRRRTVAALATVTQPEGFLAWLDTTWPMHSKRDWLTVGRILVQRSTNHRVRLLSLFQRSAA